MENLPKTLYVDPVGVYPSSNANPLYAVEDGESEFSAAPEHMKINHLLMLLHQPDQREDALSLLNKERRNKEMPLVIWNSKGIAFILLEEMTKAYRLLSPPVLDLRESVRVCNALALFQCLASHPETRMGIIKAKMPLYIYPFLNTTEEKIKHFDYLRLASLGVIGVLVKAEDSNTPEIIRFLLETDVIPLCLRCMQVGSKLAKTVAAFIIGEILMREEGQRYFGTFPERFYAVANVLSQTIDQFPAKPPTQLLLKHILTCYLRLSKLSRPCDALSQCYPARLRDVGYLNFLCEDLSVRRLADHVLNNINAVAPVVDPTPVADLLSLVRS